MKRAQAIALNLIPGSYSLVEEEPTPQGCSVFYVLYFMFIAGENFAI